MIHRSKASPADSFAHTCPKGSTPIALFLHLSFVLGAAVLVAAPPGQSPLPPQTLSPLSPGPRTDLSRPGHETEEQTITKCLQDLNSRDVKVRRRAVLILGKYRSLRARQGVIECLGDSDDAVRQSALVALSENRGIILPGAFPKVFGLLADPNVHIRRIASSLLKDMTRYSIPGVSAGGGRTRRLPTSLDQDYAPFVNQALRDTDPIVRKNILSLASVLRKLLSAEAVLGNLQDADPEIRVLAIRAYGLIMGLASERVSMDVLHSLAADPVAGVRAELVGVLARLGIQAMPILRKLAGDEDPAVSIQAVRRLIMMRDPDALELIRETVSRKDISADDRAGLIVHLARFPEAGPGLLRELSENDDSPVVRSAALRTLGALSGDHETPVGFFVGLLEEDFAEIRRAALSIIRRKRDGITYDQVEAMLDSQYADVRLGVLQLATGLPSEQRSDLIMESLLDDDIKVRCLAIRYAAVFRIPGWTDVLEHSLRDPDIEIRRAAVDAMVMRATPEILRIIQDCMKDDGDPELQEYLRSRFRGRSRTLSRPGAPRGASPAVPLLRPVP